MVERKISLPSLPTYSFIYFLPLQDGVCIEVFILNFSYNTSCKSLTSDWLNESVLKENE